MKFAVSSIDAALTTSHILNDVKEAAKINQYHGSKKLKKGILVCAVTGHCLSSVPQSLDTILNNMMNDNNNSIRSSITMFVDIQSVVSVTTVRAKISKSSTSGLSARA